MKYPENLQYTADHEWIDPDGRVGITDYAQDALGDVVFVELPEVGSPVKAGEAFGVVESVKSVSDLFSPVDGTIIKVNEELKESPEKINEDPYGAGWIVQIESPSGGDLMDVAAYRRQVEGE